jgi:hypothetical protein
MSDSRRESRERERLAAQLRAVPDGIVLTGPEVAAAIERDPGTNRRLEHHSFGEKATFHCPFCDAVGIGFMTIGGPGGEVHLTLPSDWAFSGEDGYMCRACVPGWVSGGVGSPIFPEQRKDTP